MVPRIFAAFGIIPASQLRRQSETDCSLRCAEHSLFVTLLHSHGTSAPLFPYYNISHTGLQDISRTEPGQQHLLFKVLESTEIPSNLGQSQQENQFAALMY